MRKGMSVTASWSDLEPPVWANDPSKWPSVGESASVVQAAIHASQFTTARKLVEAPRKAAFKLSKAQKALVPVVGRFQENAQPEVFAAYYVGLELAVACSVTESESGGRNIYGADPASAWVNDGPFGMLWESPVTEANFKWFWGRVEAGAVSDGVGQKQLTSVSLIAATNARGGAWLPEHNCAEGDVFFQELVSQSGSIWEAAMHYNGSGAAAVAYANRFVGLVDVWRGRLT